MRKILLLMGAVFFISGTAFGQSAGDILITEIMADPNDVTDSFGEYFELYNTTNDTIDIAGFKITDLTSSHTITGTVKISPKGFLVLAEESDTGVNGGVNADYDYPSSITLNNTSETLSLLTSGDVVISSVSYTDGNPFGAGVAMELSNLSDASSGVISEGDLIAATSAVDGSGSDLGSPGSQGNTVLDATIISGDAGWRLLSVPVSGGGKVTDISDDTAIQGITDGSNAGETTNVIQYKSGTTFVAPTNTTTDFGEGFGVGVYFYNNTTAGSSALPITLDVSGTEPSSDVVVALNTTAAGSNTGSEPTDSKYTLAGNPFASNYNLNSFTVSAGTGIQDNVHFWNDGTGSYSPQSRSASSGYVIAPWQGFWVEVASSESASQITFPTTGKATTATSGTFFSKQATEFGEIAFKLSSETTFDEAIRLNFRENASFEYDTYDASKLIPLVTEYATMAFKSNERLKSVESLPYDLTEEIELDLEEQLVGVSGEFTFDWIGLESIPSDWTLTFHDYKEGTTTDMRVETKYVFDASAPMTEKVNPLNILTGPAAVSQKTKSAGTRFGITITPNSTSVNNEPTSKVTEFALDQNYPNPFNPSTTINYSVENTGQVNVSVYNLMGQKVAELVNGTKAAGSYNVTWNASGAASGMYYYRLEAGGQTLTRKMTLIK